jgi:hypothetical protein
MQQTPTSSLDGTADLVWRSFGRSKIGRGWASLGSRNLPGHQSQSRSADDFPDRYARDPIAAALQSIATPTSPSHPLNAVEPQTDKPGGTNTDWSIDVMDGESNTTSEHHRKV